MFVRIRRITEVKGDINRPGRPNLCRNSCSSRQIRSAVCGALSGGSAGPVGGFLDASGLWPYQRGVS